MHILSTLCLFTLLNGSESWVPLESKQDGLLMEYLRRVARSTRRHHMMNGRMRKVLGMTPRKDILEKKELKWFGDISREHEDREPRIFY